MSGTRVVITGAGWVTPLGADLGSVWERMLRGESSIRAVEHFDARTFATTFASQVSGFALADHLGERRALDPVAAKLLAERAGVALGASAPAADLYRHFGITTDAIIEEAVRLSAAGGA